MEGIKMHRELFSLFTSSGSAINIWCSSSKIHLDNYRCQWRTELWRELLTETSLTDFPLQLITTCLLSLNFPNKEPVRSQSEQKSLGLVTCYMLLTSSCESQPFFSASLSDVENSWKRRYAGGQAGLAAQVTAMVADLSRLTVLAWPCILKSICRTAWLIGVTTTHWPHTENMATDPLCFS